MKIPKYDVPGELCMNTWTGTTVALLRLGCGDPETEASVLCIVCAQEGQYDYVHG